MRAGGLGGAGGDGAVLHLLQGVQHHVGGRPAALPLQLPQLPQGHRYRLLDVLQGAAEETSVGV